MAWPTVCLVFTCIAVTAAESDSPLSQPTCYIPCSDGNDIHCSWDWGPAYALYWNSDENGNESVAELANTTSGVIPRSRYMVHGYMCAWVMARGPQGPRASGKSCFIPINLEQPCAPIVTVDRTHLLEISWTFSCELADLAECQVQYRAEGELEWTGVTDDVSHSYVLKDARSFVEYSFRVRCTCDTNTRVWSSWSDICKAEITDSAPVGVPDVWSYCEDLRRSTDCTLAWKDLKRFNVKGYVVDLEHSAGKRTLNLSTALLEESNGPVRWTGDESSKYCYLPLSLRGVSAVRLTAYNAYGESEQAYLHLPITERLPPEPLTVRKEEDRGFNISWVRVNQSTDVIHEYVVQCAGVASKRFNWIKVSKTQTSVIVTGSFQNDTAYCISLFSVSLKHTSLLASAIAHFHQGVPPKLDVFMVHKLSFSEVTLAWKHIPPAESMGTILCYTVGLDNGTVYNVSKHTQRFSLWELQPGRKYEVWISARTEGGEGPRTTLNFITRDEKGFFRLLLVLMLVIILAVVGTALWYQCYCGWCLQKLLCRQALACCYDDVPDPNNSRMVKELLLHVSADLQFVNLWVELASPEAEVKPSVLEEVESRVLPDKVRHVVETHLGAAHPQEHGDISEDLRDSAALDGVSSRMEGYSTITDSAEMEEDDKSPAAEEQFFSGYEKHFMPAPWEL